MTPSPERNAEIDRELLELAAKAAGIKADKSPYNGGGKNNTGFDSSGNLVIDWYNNEVWNPLTDDGDALRLAVKLKLHIGLESECVSAWPKGRMDVFMTVVFKHFGEEAATRRALVRAAAAIGKEGKL